MAMIKCPECGKEISDTARSCPDCGWENSTIRGAEIKSSRGRKLGTGVIIFGVFVLLLSLILEMTLGGGSGTNESKFIAVGFICIIAGIVLKIVNRVK